MPVVGFLSSRSAGDSVNAVAAFRQGLAESGYVEGRNVVIEFRWAEARFERLPALAEDLARHSVSVIVAVGGYQTPSAARAVAGQIPIVFGIGEDPVRKGWCPISIGRAET
jgi:putative tryptophan/tyrosine transport system substrate-binding protein